MGVDCLATRAGLERRKRSENGAMEISLLNHLCLWGSIIVVVLCSYEDGDHDDDDDEEDRARGRCKTKTDPL